MELISFVSLCPSYKFCASANAYLEATTIIACFRRQGFFAGPICCALESGNVGFFKQLRCEIYSVAHLLRTVLTASERTRSHHVTGRLIKCILTQI